MNQFSIDENTLTFIRNNYPEVLNESLTSIHVRRGDYLKMLYKFPFCKLNYYRKAINLIGKHEIFIIVSDDIAWCKKYLKMKRVIFVENTSQIIDLYIQSFCENNIISNSSFSWWGAYLNKKGEKIIAPGLWFGFKNTQDITELLLPDYKNLYNHYSLSLYIKAWWQVILNHVCYRIKLENNNRDNNE